MRDSYPTSWKEPYRQALTESDEQKLQYATDHREECIELKRASADSLAIKTYKLGWPSIAGDSPEPRGATPKTSGHSI
jgi:hypothetical protein